MKEITTHQGFYTKSTAEKAGLGVRYTVYRDAHTDNPKIMSTVLIARDELEKMLEIAKGEHQ